MGGIVHGDDARGQRTVREDVGVKSVEPATCGIYIYGIVWARGPRNLGKIGIGDGAGSAEVRTIAWQEIAAVCSESPLVVYETLAREQTVKDLVVHQLVIEKVMGDGTILPVKFGTMVASAEEVVGFLQEGYTLLSEHLSRLQGQIELDVVCNWELSRVLPGVYRRNRQLQEKQREVAGKGEGASIEEKVALGKLVRQALGEQREHYRQVILQALTRDVAGTCLHGVVGDEMIVNAAFLLDRTKEEHFHEVVRDLDQRLSDEVNFRVVGPLPPYSFATMLFEHVDAARLEEARALFGCGGELTTRLVRDAYHRLARQYHPDTGYERDVRQFHLVQSAYRTLNQVLAGGRLHVSVYQWENDLP